VPHPSLYYRLGEPSGATVMADSSGNNQDGSYSGEGVLGGPGALATDPATSVSYATCCGGVGTTPATPPQFNAPRTVEVWLNTTTSASNGPAVIGWGTRATDQAFVVGIEPNAVLVDGGSDSHLIPTGHTLADGTWHMLAVTYDGGKVTAYLDGRAVGTALFNAPLDTLGGNLAIGGVIGYNGFGGSLRCTGSTTGPASRAATPTAAAICVPSSRPPTSTQTGSGMVRACTATCTGHRVWSTS